MQKRVAKFQAYLREHGWPAALIMAPENRRYLSGFTGSAGYLLITQGQAYLLTDSRYLEQAIQETNAYQVMQHPARWESSLADLLQQHQINAVILEDTFVTCSQLRGLQEQCPQIQWQPVNGPVDELRVRKDAEEIELLRHAVDLADRGFQHIISMLKPGVSEREVALELEFFLRRQGAEQAAFDFIIASGPRSALPHGKASEKLINLNEQVKMDFGAVYQGYHSDITRTVFIGQADAKFRSIYELVLEAQLAALAAVAPGKTGQEIDQVARKIITDHGYGENFGHGLGHGVGLMIHEGPRIAPTGDEVLQPGMILTVEPGIYLPSWGGVRIEDMVLVTKTGAEVLTKSPKALLEL